MGTSTLTGPAWGRGLDRSTKLLPHAARRHNRALVLQTLISHEGASRADIARETELTRVTVSDLIAELIETGIVEELGQSASGRRGKPATLLRVDPESRHIVGLDLSHLGHLRAAVFNLTGDKLWQYALDTDEVTGEEAASLVVDLAERAVAHVKVPLLGVGVGSPGIVDPEGTVLTAPNFEWHDYPLGPRLRESLGLPVHVANDSNAAVMAASSFDGYQDDLMVINFGYGIGAGILLDGVPRLGPNYAAGEIGHLVVGTDGGPACACGKNGCLEAWVSQPHLRRALAEARGDEERAEVLSEGGRRLGIVIAPIIAALNLTEVVLCGPSELLEGPFLSAAQRAVRERLLTALAEPFTFRMMPNSRDAVLRGAAAIVLAAELGVS